MQDKRLQRVASAQLALPNERGIPLHIWANDNVPIQKLAVDELLALLAVQDTAQRLAQHYAAGEVAVDAVSISPDFHKGSGIPIGTTLQATGFCIPAAIGSDVNCGMRLATTGILANELTPQRIAKLQHELRGHFFGGKRAIALTPRQRHAMLSHGVAGLLDNGVGCDNDWDDLNRMHDAGGYETSVPSAFAEYVNGATTGSEASYDAHIGSLGGGNHFAEIQVVEEVFDKQTAYAWGLSAGQVVVMIHSGSLGFGHIASGIAKQACHSLYPKAWAAPANGIYPLLTNSDAYADAYLAFTTAMHVAANFAFANRFFLQRMVADAMYATGMTNEMRLVYDSPHNLLWQQDEQTFLHRKGSTPARGWQNMQGTTFASSGEPVIVPGSMGTSSFLLRGQSNHDALHSSAHGAGRALARGSAMQGHSEALEGFLRDFNVVTPIDPQRHDLRGRTDITLAWKSMLMQEAPWAYKDIGQVVTSIEQAQIASPVARMRPVVTVKG